jgi:hypothetical protein
LVIFRKSLFHFENILAHTEFSSRINLFFLVVVTFKQGKPDFLGRSYATPIARSETNYGRPCKLEWIELRKGNDNAGELLACFELFLLDEKSPNKYIPNLPPKMGALYRVPSGIRPELQRTMIEVLSWGVRNMKTFQLSDVDCPQVIFECGGQKVESEVIKNVKQNPNFSKPVLYFDIVSLYTICLSYCCFMGKANF